MYIYILTHNIYIYKYACTVYIYTHNVRLLITLKKIVEVFIKVFMQGQTQTNRCGRCGIGILSCRSDSLYVCINISKCVSMYVGIMGAWFEMIRCVFTSMHAKTYVCMCVMCGMMSCIVEVVRSR